MNKPVIYFALLLSVSAAAQTAGDGYRLPIDGGLSLSANYGELRANHFHAGLDIRVGGAPGMPLYAVADGYVSRILARPDGYGRAVYITHPNGTTSVYAHLHAFSPAIKSYIENIQYALQRAQIDQPADSAALPVKKGALIGTAGNSGASQGAHLHFEIRDTPSDIPVNVFSRGYYTVPADTYPPTIRAVAFFAFSQAADSIPQCVKFYEQPNPSRKAAHPIDVPDTFYVGIDAYDSHNGAPAKLAYNRLCVAVDGDTVFACRMEDIPFDATRRINSAIAYDERQRHHGVFLKTYIEPQNTLPIYRHVQNDGLISLPDSLPHALEIPVTDDAGNSAAARFTVQKKPVAIPAAVPAQMASAARHNRQTTITRHGLQVIIPAGALYRSAWIEADSLPERPAAACSPYWHIHTPETPLHYAMTVKMAAQLPDSLHAKALIAGITSRGVYAVGGRWRHNAVEAATRAFGDFFVTIDTIAPVIKPAFAAHANLRRQAELRIRVTDNLSGIAAYSGYIDGKWALFEYDPKNNLLRYRFDPQRLPRNMLHRLLLTVTDAKQNTATLQTTFYW